MGLGSIGGGFSKTDGVPLELVESQWGCPESQWGRVLMGILQGGGEGLVLIRRKNRRCWLREQSPFMTGTGQKLKRFLSIILCLQTIKSSLSLKDKNHNHHNSCLLLSYSVHKGVLLKYTQFM